MNKDSYNKQIIQCVNDTIFIKRFRGYPVLEQVLKLWNWFLGTGSYVKSLEGNASPFPAGRILVHSAPPDFSLNDNLPYLKINF